MHEESYEMLCKMREHLVEAAKKNMDAGIECVNTDEMGKVIDMIKDLYQAEKYHNESQYYAAIAEAMEEASEEEYSGRMGYSDKHHIRFDPLGARWDKDDIHKMPMHEVGNMRMGYVRENKGVTEDEDSRYGRAYNDYRKARRHFTETKSVSDKDMMDMKAGDHMADSIHTIHEIWEMADPNLRKKMKADLQKLVGEMTI